MNYTKLIREYCKNNSGAIFDVSKLKDTEFAEVPYNSSKNRPKNEILSYTRKLDPVEPIRFDRVYLFAFLWAITMTLRLGDFTA